MDFEDVNFEQIIDHLGVMRDLQIIRYGYNENTHFRREEDISRWIKQLGYSNQESEEIIDFLLAQEYLAAWEAENGNKDISNIRVCVPSRIHSNSIKNALNICLDHLHWKQDLLET